MQLAVTHDGVVGGTAYDQVTNAAYPIHGLVERRTQRTVWEFTNDRGRRVIMESSLFNLTQPEATGMVYYGPDDMRVMQLVRLEAPQGASASTRVSEGELPGPPSGQRY